MRVTKFAHSCIRIESDSNSLVIDPGIFTTPDAVDGVDAILITHEHADHFSPELLQRAAAPVYTIAAVAAKLPTEWDVTVVAPGEEFHAAGSVHHCGRGDACVTHPDVPRFFDSGFVVTADATRLYHPGDSLTPPPVRVDVCCLPISGPWLKLAEAIDFARSVRTTKPGRP